MEVTEKIREFMYGISLGILKNPMDAEDAVQEALILIYTKMDLYDPNKSSFRTWCCQIAKYQALQLVRKRSIRINRTVELDDRLHSEEEEEDVWYDNTEFTSDYLGELYEIIRSDSGLIRYNLVDDFIKYYSGDKGNFSMNAELSKPKLMSFDSMAESHNMNAITIRAIFRRAKNRIKSILSDPNEAFSNKDE